MREINVSQLTDVIEKLCIEANCHLPGDVKCAIKSCRACEDGEIAKGVLDNIIKNYEIADAENVPICQDTGMACVFLEIGQDVHFVGGDLTDAINEGIDEKGIDKATGRVLVEVSPDFYRPTDVVNLWGDPSKAKRVLGWNPEKTSLEELVHIMVQHDLKKVKVERTEEFIRTNLAEYLEKGVTK